MQKLGILDNNFYENIFYLEGNHTLFREKIYFIEN